MRALRGKGSGLFMGCTEGWAGRYGVAGLDAALV